MSDGSNSKISKYKDVEVDEEPLKDVGNTNVNFIKHLYRDETYIQKFCTYYPPPIEFLGSRENALVFKTFLIILTLWNLFWPHIILQQIVEEINHYATQILDIMGSTMGRAQLGSIDYFWVEGFFSNHNVYEHERTIQYQKLLRKA